MQAATAAASDKGLEGLASFNLWSTVGRDEVVGEPDRAVASGVHGLGDAADVVPRGEIGADLGSELHGVSCPPRLGR